MKKLLLLAVAVMLLSAVLGMPATAQIGVGGLEGITTWGWLWQFQAFGTVGFGTDLSYLGTFYGRYGSTPLSCRATVNGISKSGVPVSFTAKTLWGVRRSTSFTMTSGQGTVAARVNWGPDVYEIVVKSSDGAVSSPAALTIYSTTGSTTYAGGTLLLGTERRRATFGLRYGTSPSVLSGLLFLDPDEPAGFTRITSTSFRRIASPAGTRKYAGVCTFQGPGQPPVGANLFLTTSTQTTGFTFSIKVVAVWMEVLYDVTGKTVNSGAKWGRRAGILLVLLIVIVLACRPTTYRHAQPSGDPCA